MENEALTSWEEANGLKRLFTGAPIRPGSWQVHFRSRLNTNSFQACFLEECRKQKCSRDHRILTSYGGGRKQTRLQGRKLRP